MSFYMNEWQFSGLAAPPPMGSYVSESSSPQ